MRFAHFFVKMALRAIRLQSKERWKVGCIVVNKAGRVISTGYNRRRSDDTILHAEVMALSKLTVADRYGAIVYCTWSPCKCCEQYMRDYGVSRVYYMGEYSLNLPVPQDLCTKF